MPVETPEVFGRDPKTGKLTPSGQAARWTMEFQAARDRFKKWHKQGTTIEDRFLDERDTSNAGLSKLNLFTANVETQHAMLYGRVPTVDVARAEPDSSDDVARVAAEMLERLLTPRGSQDSYAIALGYVLEDRLLPGLGFACARYEVETEPATDEAGAAVLDEDGEPVERKTSEKVEVDHHYWKDLLYSPCRKHEDARWYAWPAPMTREGLIARFGEEIGKQIPMNTKTGKKGESDAQAADPWARADVWEIWSKEDRTVYWYVEGYAQILDEKPDPLGLEGFYPFPKPLICRPTTRAFIPRPDYVLAQDLYNEIDNLTSRIKLLEDAVRVAGVFNKASPEVARLLTDSGFNKLYPSEDWGAFSEKGGFKGAVDWFPLEQVVAAIGVLTEKRAEKIGLLQQVTGWSDIMRGQSNASETLGAQQLKAQYGSVRIAKFQGEFARFATDLQRIRAEIISRHFDVETIIEQSNVLHTADAQHAQAAAALIKDRVGSYRIEVKPENINLTDYAQLKQERTEVLASLSALMSAMGPLIQTAGAPAAEFALAAGAWMLAGVKGGDSLEAEFDKFRARVQEKAKAAEMQPPQPDPKVIALQARAKADQFKAQASMALTAMDAKAGAAEHGQRMNEIQAETVQTQMEAQAHLLKSQWQTSQPGPGIPHG